MCYSYKGWRSVDRFVKFLLAGVNLEANIPGLAGAARPQTLGLGPGQLRDERAILDRIRALRPAALEDDPQRGIAARAPTSVAEPAPPQVRARDRATRPRSPTGAETPLPTQRPTAGGSASSPQTGLVAIRLLSDARLFKEALVAVLRALTLQDTVQIQAYHLDCPVIIQALCDCRALWIQILADSRTAVEVSKTRQALRKLEEGGAQVKTLAGESMAALYGNRRVIHGIQHTKAVHIISVKKQWLWIGSCNFTQASDYNLEAMVEVSQSREAVLPHPIFEEFEQQFREKFGRAATLNEPLQQGSSSTNAVGPLVGTSAYFESLGFTGARVSGANIQGTGGPVSAPYPGPSARHQRSTS